MKIGIADEDLWSAVARFDALEFSGNGTVVFERNGVKVIAVKVDHREKIKPAYGLRADCWGHSVTISSDTRRSENLMSFAGGVDLLNHEIATFNEQLLAANPGFRAILTKRARCSRRYRRNWRSRGACSFCPHWGGGQQPAQAGPCCCRIAPTWALASQASGQHANVFNVLEVIERLERVARLRGLRLADRLAEFDIA